MELSQRPGFPPTDAPAEPGAFDHGVIEHPGPEAGNGPSAGYGAPAYGTPGAYWPAPAPAGAPPKRTGLRRILAPLGAAAAAVVKYGAILWKLKVLVVVGSMLVSLVAYAWLWGLPFAAGFVALIFVHEMGHVVVLRRQGVRAGVPTFLPFLGAFVRMKSAPRDVGSEAVSALAGPVVGSIGALLCWWAADATGSPMLRGLAYVGFFINLFNLLPALPLDGGRVAGALHPAIWLAGLLALLGWEIVRPSPVIPIVLVLGGLELYRRWRGRRSADSRRYHSIPLTRRVQIGGAYLALVVFLLIAMHATYLPRSL